MTAESSFHPPEPTRDPPGPTPTPPGPTVTPPGLARVTATEPTMRCMALDELPQEHGTNRKDGDRADLFTLSDQAPRKRLLRLRFVHDLQRPHHPLRNQDRMTQKTAVGSFDGGWLPILALLISLSILPKSIRPAVGTASTALLIYKIGKRIGWW